MSDFETYVHDTDGTKPVIIGRSSEADFTVEDNELSRKHCEVRFEGHRVFVKDLESKNGVKVDGERIQANKYVEVFPETVIMLTNSLQLSVFSGETRTGLKLEAYIPPKPIVKYKKIKNKIE